MRLGNGQNVRNQRTLDLDQARAERARHGGSSRPRATRTTRALRPGRHGAQAAGPRPHALVLPRARARPHPRRRHDAHPGASVSRLAAGPAAGDAVPAHARSPAAGQAATLPLPESWTRLIHNRLRTGRVEAWGGRLEGPARGRTGMPSATHRPASAPRAPHRARPPRAHRRSCTRADAQGRAAQASGGNRILPGARHRGARPVAVRPACLSAQVARALVRPRGAAGIDLGRRTARLRYSTVTALARLRGLSTSVPRASAAW